MYLVDTNVWVEVLLDQEHAEEAKSFLDGASASGLYVTEFSLYSLGIILTRAKKAERFLHFIEDALKRVGVQRIVLKPSDMGEVLAAHTELALDFDDAYQYVAAAKHGLTLVSFDADVDKTPRGRRSPGDAT